MNEERQTIKISKKWVARKGFLGFWRREIEVEAEQTPLPQPLHPRIATARFSIRVNGERVADGDIDWHMLVGKEMLLLQIYMAAKCPDAPYREWQWILEAFCFRFENFKPPAKMWWTNEPIFD